MIDTCLYLNSNHAWWLLSENGRLPRKLAIQDLISPYTAGNIRRALRLVSDYSHMNTWVYIPLKWVVTINISQLQMKYVMDYSQSPKDKLGL